MHEGTLRFYNYTPKKKDGYKNKFCKLPWENIIIDEDGDVMLCGCQSHMPYSIGNIYNESLQTIWNGSRAQSVRQSVIDGDYTYCRSNCPALLRLPDMPATLPVLVGFPKKIRIDMDKSCNLKCPSCREHVIIEKKSEKINKQINLYKELHQWALDTPDSLISLTPVGSGEIFASHSGIAFLKMLADQPCKNLHLHLDTNGTLIMKNQELIKSLASSVKLWSISLDASTPETYAKVRGGNWEELLAGLELLKELRTITVFRFCVQKNNYHEIDSFADLVATFNGKVDYQNLSDWGHQTPDWWQSNSVFSDPDMLNITRDKLRKVNAKYKLSGIAFEFSQLIKESP